MSDIAEVTENADPKPLVLKVRGVTYEVPPFNMIQVGRVQKAIKLLPCPYNTRAVRREMSAKMAAGECSQADMEAAIGRSAAGEESWPPRLMEDPEAQSLLYYEEPVQVAMVREALALPSDAEARSVLEGMRPVQYMTLVIHCFQVGDPESVPVPNGQAPASGTNGSTTTIISPTSSPAPDGPGSISSGSPSPSSSATPA
jgi:hypothetical protein